MVGLGTEYMITQNWTAFIEYNYVEFDRKGEANNINLASLGSATVNADFKNKLSIAKVGVNCKFDWGASGYSASFRSHLDYGSRARCNAKSFGRAAIRRRACSGRGGSASPAVTIVRARRRPTGCGA